MNVKFLPLFLVLSLGSCSVIIPEELPSLLSVAYSNIPPIKKGNDHRVGFGFAFGNHADFQVLFELGPQTNTLNLTGQPFPSASGGNTKRQALSAPAKLNKNREKYLQSDAGKYLQGWAQKMKHQKPVYNKTPATRPGDVPNLEDSMVELVKNSAGQYEIHQPRPDNMPPGVLDDLKRLYALKKEEAVKMTVESKRSKEEIKKITEDLSNVDLD